jgi:glutathione S-transferase
MLTLFDYLPSQNAWKVRLLLNHLELAYDTVSVSIFEGEGGVLKTQKINPTGKVPAIRLEDGSVLAESNAILSYLADGTQYLPAGKFARAKVHQWLSFEQEHIEANVGGLRYWAMTGKLPRRPVEAIAARHAAALRALGILDEELAAREFIAGTQYTIADMSVFAYGSRAEEAGVSLDAFPYFREWIGRVESQPGFLATMYPYSIDPHSSGELP